MRWLYKRRKRRGGKRSAKASVKDEMSSRQGVMRMGVRRLLYQTSEGGLEDLATVGYQKSVRWSPTREEKWKVETGGRKCRKVLTSIPDLSQISRPCRERCDQRKERKLTKIRKSALSRKEKGEAE